MIPRLRSTAEWRFLEELPRGNAPLAAAWFGMLFLRGALPAAFAVAMGAAVTQVQAGREVTAAGYR